MPTSAGRRLGWSPFRSHHRIQELEALAAEFARAHPVDGPSERETSVPSPASTEHHPSTPSPAPASERHTTGPKPPTSEHHEVGAEVFDALGPKVPDSGRSEVTVRDGPKTFALGREDAVRLLAGLSAEPVKSRKYLQRQLRLLFPGWSLGTMADKAVLVTWSTDDVIWIDEGLSRVLFPEAESADSRRTEGSE